MRWKLKAAIQRACAALPFGNEPAYYFLQSVFGRLRSPASPLPMLTDAARIVGELQQAGFDLKGKRVMEVGTGRRIDMPLAFYLCGASSIATYDLHRYLKPHLVMGGVAEILRERSAVLELLESVAPGDLAARLDALARASDFEAVLNTAGVEYHAPADAARTHLPAASIDLHFSYTVFEHIPSAVLMQILREASRLLKPGGLACHHIDPSDHFSHEDPSISAINFLQYSQEDWDRQASNQFAYHNRMRARDYAALYKQSDHEIVHWAPWIDERSRRVLQEGFRLAPEFAALPPEELCTIVVRVLSRPNGAK